MAESGYPLTSGLAAPTGTNAGLFESFREDIRSYPGAIRNLPDAAMQQGFHGTVLGPFVVPPLILKPGGPASPLAAKLATIKADLRRIPKNGKNEHFGYKFAQESDVVEYVREACGSVGIDVSCFQVQQQWERYVRKGFKGDIDATRATVHVRMVITDADSGERWVFDFIDIADDDQDKAVKKAATGARKYVHLLAFDLATGDDPDGFPPVGGAEPPKAKEAPAAAPKAKTKADIHAKWLQLYPYYALEDMPAFIDEKLGAAAKRDKDGKLVLSADEIKKILTALDDSKGKWTKAS